MKIKILTTFLSILFLASGVAKVLGLEFETEAFQRWEYPTWFMYMIGFLEVSGAVALMIPKLATLAALALSGVMVGAVFTHLIYAEWVMLLVASIILGLAIWRTYSGRADLLALCRLIKGS